MFRSRFTTAGRPSALCSSACIALPTTQPSRTFTARCYASAVLAMALCLSDRLSVTSRCSIETAERIELVFST